MWEYRAAPLRVIDGDTIVILADTGFGGRQEEHIRLLDVLAPELNEPGGPEAKQYVIDWMAQLPAVRWPLLVRTQPNTNPEPTERRTLTRYLATVVQLGTDRVLNADVGDYLNAHPEWNSGGEVQQGIAVIKGV